MDKQRDDGGMTDRKVANEETRESTAKMLRLRGTPYCAVRLAPEGRWYLTFGRIAITCGTLWEVLVDAYIKQRETDIKAVIALTKTTKKS